MDAGLVNSRSEAAAFLVSEGVKAKAGLFQRMSEKIENIRKARDELRELLDEPPDDGEGQAR